MKPGLALSAVLAVLALTPVGAQAPPQAVQAGFPARGAWLGGGTRVLDQFLGKVLAALEP